MSSEVSTICDGGNSVEKKLGENNHAEYAWSSDMQERIVQFQFQCVRCSTNELYKLEHILRSLILLCENSVELIVLYKIIGQTRDIDFGKGERDLSYMMIYVWNDYYESLAQFALSCFVNPIGDGKSYGSWKDIKKLCQYVFQRTNDPDHSIIRFCITLMCDNLRMDNAIDDASEDSLSLCARWVPRESSTNGCWLFRKLAVSYFPQFINTAKSEESKKKALNKTYMEFGNLIAKLNKRLDTVQIKMCGKRWAEIDHHKTTSVTLIKNRAAFMNKSNKHTEDPDRIKCAENFAEYINSRVSAGKEVKGTAVGLVDFIKAGLNVDLRDSVSVDTLNAQWSSFMSKVGDLENMVAMVDQSGSMTCDGGNPYYAAFGLGIVIAQKSAIGKRIMPFSTDPQWLDVEGDFITCVNKMKEFDVHAGFGTNFFAALDLLLKTCIEEKLPDSVVSNMTLAIFSDMQIDDNYNIVEERVPLFENAPVQISSFSDRMLSMHERILAKYIEAGYSSVPHILFWNLRHTSGFPTISNVKNATMFSGFSPLLLNSFCEKGQDVLMNTNSWDSLIDSLSHPRYAILENKIKTFVKY